MSQGMMPVGHALEQLLMQENNPEEFQRRKGEEDREREARKLREQKALEEEAARKEQERKQKWEEEERRAAERREADRREKEEQERAAREREAAEVAEAAAAPRPPPPEGGASQSQGMDFGATQDLIPTQAVGRKGEVGEGGGSSLNSQEAGSAVDTQLSRKRSRTPSPPPPVQSAEEVEAPPAKKPKLSPKPQQPKSEKAGLFRAPARKRKSKMPPHPYVVVEQARREMAEENKKLLMEEVRKQGGEEIIGMDDTEFEIWFDQTQSTMGIPLTIASQRGAAAEPDSASRVAGWLGSGEPGFRDNLPEKEVRAQLQKGLRERTGEGEPEAVDPTPPAAMGAPTLNGQTLTYLNLTREQHQELAKIDRDAGKAYNDYFKKKRALAIDPKDASKPLGTFPLHAIKDGKAFGYVMGSGTKDPKGDREETTPLKEKPEAEAEDVLGSILKFAPAVKKNKKRKAPGTPQNDDRFVK